jgi:ornithine cyclodeaminase/alanine dehydrogenase-like protein (mu-crystallin family)
MAIPSYTYFKLKMLGPYGVIIITGSFPNAYECEMLVVEQAQRDLILDEPKHADKDKQEAGSRTP